MVTQPGRKAEASKIEPEKSKEPESQINAIFGDIIKKKKKNTKKEDDLSEEEQKTQQISRMAKESFIKLFEYLQIKINIPTVVQLKKRADPFNPVRRDKYGGYRITFHDTHIYCYDKAPELITADYPTYYEKKDKPNVVQQQLQQAIPEEADSSMEIINMGSAKKEENPEETKARIEEDLNELEKKLLKKMTAEDNAMFSQKPKKINRRRTHAFGTYAFSDESSEDFDEYNSDDSQDDNPRQLFKSKSEVKDRNRLSSPPKNQEGMMPIDNPIPAAASNNNDFYNPFQAFQQQQQNRESNHDASSSEDQGGEAKDGIKSHLNDLFNLQNQNSNCFSLSEPPKTFKSTLHMYQKQALTWMKYREGCLENQRLYDKLNEEIRLLNDLFEEIVLIDGSKIYFNPFNGEITLDFPLSKPTKGGILADEMGLGKTVMTIALIHAHCREAKKKEKEEKKKETSQKKKGRRRASDSDDEEDEEEQQEPEPDDDHHGSEYDENDIDNIASKRGPKKNKKVKKSFGSLQPAVSSGKAGTLIVVPVTVLTQWEDEIYTHSHEGTMKVLQYYGGARAFKKNKIEDFDVVLTTYGVLSADFTKKEKDSKNTSKTLFDYEWFRVILDEAHNVKEKSTRAAKAACGLNTSYRWCLSGTPIQNKIDDIFSIIKFLRVDTWGEYFLWNTYINKHVSNDESFELLRNILRPILLRRTKKSTYSDGTCILALPPKEIKTHTISLTNEEKQIYDYLFYRGKNQFDQIVNGGTLQYEYAHIFELLMRLRQVCNHPGLVFSSADLRNSDNLENAILKFLDKRATSSTLANKKNFVAPLPSSSAAANRGPQNNNNNAQSSSNGISSGFVQETINNLKNKRLEPCTVCLDDIVDPVVTNCCHVFCKGCIAHVIEKLKSCPICRKNLTMTDVISVVV